MWPYRDLTVYHERFSCRTCHKKFYSALQHFVNIKTTITVLTALATIWSRYAFRMCLLLTRALFCSECEPCFKTVYWRL